MRKILFVLCCAAINAQASNTVYLNGSAIDGAVIDITTAGTVVPTPPPPPPPPPPPVSAGCQVVDATGYQPGNVYTGNQGYSSPSAVISYRFTVAQLLGTGKRGMIQLYETYPQARFELSNIPCDQTMPLPAPSGSDYSSFEVCSRLGSGGDRYPTLQFMTADNPNAWPNTSRALAWETYAICTLQQPAQGGFYYLNVTQNPGCAPGCTYQIYYWQQS